MVKTFIMRGEGRGGEGGLPKWGKFVWTQPNRALITYTIPGRQNRIIKIRTYKALKLLR